MDTLYEGLASGLDNLQALRQAQLSLLSQSRQATDHTQIYAHPAYWAPFILNGAWYRA